MCGALLDHGRAVRPGHRDGLGPGGRQLVVGTSAGAVVGALTLAGAKPWEPLAPDRENLFRAALNGASFHLQPTLRSLWPGSPQPVRRALLAGPSYAMNVVAGAVPQGFVSTEPIVSGSSWPGWGRLSSLGRR